MQLITQDAVNYVLNNSIHTTYYSMSKILSKGPIKVQPIQVSNYHKGKRVMSKKTAEYFYEVFGITILDRHSSKGRPSEF